MKTNPLSPDDEKALDEILGLLVIAGDSATIQNVRDVKAALVTLLLKQWRAVLENYQKETDSTNYIIMRDRLEERIAQINAQIKQCTRSGGGR